MNDPQPLPIPEEFICPITLEIMRSPLMCRSGVTFERSAILAWLQDHGSTNPLTRETLTPSGLVPNRALEARISAWCKENNIDNNKDQGCDQRAVELTHLFTYKVAPVEKHKRKKRSSRRTSIHSISRPDRYVQPLDGESTPRRVPFLRRLIQSGI
jgi:hypothetical protein